MSSDCDSHDVPSLSNFEIRHRRKYPSGRICVIIVLVVLFLVLLFVVIGLAVGLTSRFAPLEPRVTTPCGDVIGDIQSGIYRFLGLPYAQPPVGKLRFRRPRDIYTASNCPGGVATRTATTFQSPCLQKNPIQDELRGSEDCLYLNVFSPNIRPGSKLPVIVVVGGLFFLYGGSNEPGLQVTPALIKSTDAVHVTISTRLGTFGFLPSEDANVGVWDMISALHWVKNFISKFGGDPDNVMLFGYGSGATSSIILSMAASSTTFDLFHKVWVASPMLRVDQTEKNATLAYQKRYGCISKYCLENKTATELEAMMTLDRNLRNSWFGLPDLNRPPHKPSILLQDDFLIRQSPFNASYHRVQDIPIVIGSTTNEVDVYLWPDGVRFWNFNDTFKHVKRYLKLSLADLESVKSLYPSSSGTVEDVYTRIVTDIRVTCPLQCFSRKIRPLSKQIYQYVMSSGGRYVDPYQFDLRINNSFHGWDALLYFSDGSLDLLASAAPSKGELAMRERMREAVRQFAWSGRIDEFKASGINLINSKGEVEVRNGYKKSECEIWSRVANGNCYSHAWGA